MRRNASAILLVGGFFILVVLLNFIFLVEDRSAEETEQTGRRSSYFGTPYGTLAYYTLLQESGYQVTRFESPFTQLAERTDIGTVVTISPPESTGPNEEEIEGLNSWIEAGGLAIVIDREIRVSFGEADASTAPGNPRSVVRPLQPTPYTKGVTRLELSNFASRVTLDSRTTTYHMGDDQSAILAEAKVGEGGVVLLTEPFVVANNGISRADNVILALNLLSGRPQGKIAFDEYHHGFRGGRSEGLMSYFSGTPIPWMMAQAALIALLLVYTQGRRFARAVPLSRERRTTNLEFVASMANITRLARASDLAMQNIYSDFRRRLCRYSGLPTNAQTSQLTSVAARRARKNPNELGQLLSRCEQVARGDKVSDAELLTLVARIRGIESALGLSSKT